MPSRTSFKLDCLKDAFATSSSRVAVDATVKVLDVPQAAGRMISRIKSEAYFINFLTGMVHLASSPYPDILKFEGRGKYSEALFAGQEKEQ